MKRRVRCASLVLCLLPVVTALAGEPAAGVGADDALRTLLDGNRRFVSGKPSHARQDAARRAAVAEGQKPMAVVLSCSDSRVPPEILFDQGLGEIGRAHV